MTETLRKEIDTIDEKIIDLIHQRILVMKKIGEEKKKEGKPIRDLQREQAKLETIEQTASMFNIPITLVINIWRQFFEISEDIEK